MPLDPTPQWPGTGLDSLPDPTSATYVDDDGFELDLLLQKHNAILEAIEARLGSTLTGTPGRGKAILGKGTDAGIWDTLARKNCLINGGFRVWQRGATPTVVDNGYGPDRWRLLLEAANAAAIAQETSDVPSDGGKSAAKLTVGSGEDNKFGIWSVLEGIDVKHLRGKSVSLQAKLKATAAITDVRMAVVEFTGTEDSVSGDPISAWGTAGTNPTLAASYAYLGTPANLSPTTSWATYFVEGLTVGASANNLAVFVWCEDETTTVTTDVLRVTDVQLEEGAVCTAFERRLYAQELTLCQRYFERLASSGTSHAFTFGTAAATDDCRFLIAWSVQKRTNATVTFSDNSDLQALNASFAAAAAGTLTVASAGTRVAQGRMASIAGAPLVQGNAVLVRWTDTDGYIDASSEL